VTGQETFEFAAAVAGAAIGLAAILLLSLLAVIGTWRLFRLASDASNAATRATLGIEELARSLAVRPAAPPPPAEANQFVGLRQQAETLLEEQRRLQATARDILDAAAMSAQPAPAALEGLEAAIARLDATVGQMAAHVANLIQQLEERQRRGT
jgi:hypothetical protein